MRRLSNESIKDHSDQEIDYKKKEVISVVQPVSFGKPSNRHQFKKKLTLISEARLSQELDLLEVENELLKRNLLSHILVNIFSSSFNLICIFLIETINLIFMGTTDEPNLNIASVGLGNIYLNFAGVLIGFGILGGLDTMGSHAYGSYHHVELGVYTVRTRIILLAVFFMVCLPLAFASCYFLISINILPELAYNSYYYIIYMLPAIFFTFNFNLNIRYLQVMQIYFTPSLITITALLVHILLCYILVSLYSLGIVGICISSGVTMLYCFVLSTGYIIVTNPCPQSLFLKIPANTFNYEKFKEYSVLCLLSGIQHYGDYIGYEIACFMCSYLAESSMAATLIVLNYQNVIGYLYVGFSFPLSHLVGIFLGRNDQEMYAKIVKLFTWINTITAILLSVPTYIFAQQIAYLYTSDADAASKAASIFYMWSFAIPFDVFNIMYQGILRGAGKQHIPSAWNLIMSVFWMVPVSFLLCYILKWDLYGIWLGCISYVIILSIIYFFYVIFLDTNEASMIIRGQLEEDIESILSENLLSENKFSIGSKSE